MLHFLFKGFNACYVKHFKLPSKRHVLPVSLKRTYKCLNVVCFHITFICRFSLVPTWSEREANVDSASSFALMVEHTEPASVHEPVIHCTKNWQLGHFTHYITSFISSLFTPRFAIYSVFFSKAPSLVRFYQRTCLLSLPKPPSCLFFISICAHVICANLFIFPFAVNPTSDISVHFPPLSWQLADSRTPTKLDQGKPLFKWWPLSSIKI